jgi:FkbM family methyltransferase
MAEWLRRGLQILARRFDSGSGLQPSISHCPSHGTRYEGVMTDSLPAPRPLALRLAPARLRRSLYSRLYAARHAAHPRLFARAPLRFAEGVDMFDLTPGDIISGHIAFTGEYEPKLSHAIRGQAERGGLFVDVGANMGYFSLLWASARPGNRVIAFEASPRVAAQLGGNVERNGLGDAVRIVGKAASDAAGTVRFSTGPADQTGWGGIQPDNPEAIEVPAVRLDEELAGEAIAVLKVDVEGAESLVLRGAEELLRERRIGLIFFEWNPERAALLGLEFADLIAFLESTGYRAVPFNAERTEWRAEPA